MCYETGGNAQTISDDESPEVILRVDFSARVATILPPATPLSTFPDVQIHSWVKRASAVRQSWKAKGFRVEDRVKN